MKRITEIKAQVKTPTRCNIYLDGAYYCALELETVMKNRLKAGVDIEEEELDRLQAESETSRALDKTLNFISRSKKTKKQVQVYLKQKGYTDTTISKVLEKTDGYGFTDDSDYAKDYAKSYSLKKGKRLIEAELKSKGVSERDIDEALEGTSEEEGAKLVAEKYLKNKPKERVTALKCYKYLLGKGFSYDTAKAAVESIYGDEDI
ncbi:MAG: RecX family transcriptional regulator [Clostridia bacterium]|nr:RecX family transcriptional regulator [Clostridia bacterium]